MTLRPRQELLLRAVVEEYIASGSPVSSRYLGETYDLDVAASTIRNDLATLEEEGLLAHPHTSAGRVPTDAGYRYYVDALLHEHRERRPVCDDGAHGDASRAELDEALRETAEALSRATELLSVVSAPSLAFTSVRHIEVLLLQPHLVMVVVITSSGRVGKRVFRFDEAVDQGLTDFARDYLNEQLQGAHLGTRVIDRAFVSPDLGVRERAFLATLRPAFEVAGAMDRDDLLVGGASRLLEALSAEGMAPLEDLVEVLEERVSLLELVYDALHQDGLYLRIGRELSRPSLQSCALVAANYGVANRNVGTVSVLGPTRMDYQRVIKAVRSSADSLSVLLEEIW